MNNNQVLPNVLGVYQGDLVFTFAEVHSQIVADAKNKCVKCAIQFTNPMAINSILSEHGISTKFKKGDVASVYVFLKCPNSKIAQILAEKLQQANLLKLGMVGKLTPQMSNNQLQLLLTVEYGQLIAANQIANTLHTDTYTVDDDSADAVSENDSMRYPGGQMPQSEAPRNDMKQSMPMGDNSNMGQMPPKQSADSMMPGANQQQNDLDIDMSDLGNAPKPEQQPIQQQAQGGNPMPGAQQRMQPQGNPMRQQMQGQMAGQQNPMMSAAGYNQGAQNPMDSMPQMPR